MKKIETYQSSKKRLIPQKQTRPPKEARIAEAKARLEAATVARQKRTETLKEIDNIISTFPQDSDTPLKAAAVKYLLGHFTDLQSNSFKGWQHLTLEEITEDTLTELTGNTILDDDTISDEEIDPSKNTKMCINFCIEAKTDTEYTKRLQNAHTFLKLPADTKEKLTSFLNHIPDGRDILLQNIDVVKDMEATQFFMTVAASSSQITAPLLQQGTWDLYSNKEMKEQISTHIYKHMRSQISDDIFHTFPSLTAQTPADRIATHTLQQEYKAQENEIRNVLIPTAKEKTSHFMKLMALPNGRGLLKTREDEILQCNPQQLETTLLALRTDGLHLLPENEQWFISSKTQMDDKILGKIEELKKQSGHQGNLAHGQYEFLKREKKLNEQFKMKDEETLEQIKDLLRCPHGRTFMEKLEKEEKRDQFFMCNTPDYIDQILQCVRLPKAPEQILEEKYFKDLINLSKKENTAEGSDEEMKDTHIEDMISEFIHEAKDNFIYQMQSYDKGFEYYQNNEGKLCSLNLSDEHFDFLSKILQDTEGFEFYQKHEQQMLNLNLSGEHFKLLRKIVKNSTPEDSTSRETFFKSFLKLIDLDFQTLKMTQGIHSRSQKRHSPLEETKGNG